MLNVTEKQNGSFLLDGIKDLSVEKGKDAWGKPCKKNISEVSFIGSGSLRKCKLRKRRRRQEVQVGDSVYPACALKITSDDVNRMVSKCFSSLCEEYYERCMKLDELIASDVPEDDVFMKAINSGPLYRTDCCRFVISYSNKFKNSIMMKNTVLSDPSNLTNKDFPPMDIYEQVALMDVASPKHYVVARGVEATEALSGLRNKFCTIDCSMATQIAYYEVILLIVGKKIFNENFGRSTNLPLNVSVSVRGRIKRALSPFHSFCEIPRNNDKKQERIPPLTVQKGHLYYFSNHSDYLKKHPKGAYSGLNVMLVNIINECPYFTGFGLPGEGVNTQYIISDLIYGFNRSAEADFQELHQGVSSFAKEQAYRFQEKIITTEEYYANNGGWLSLGGARYLDLSKIQRHLLRQFVSSENNQHTCPTKTQLEYDSLLRLFMKRPPQQGQE